MIILCGYFFLVMNDGSKEESSDDILKAHPDY